MIIPWELNFYTDSFIPLLRNEHSSGGINMNFIYCYENKINHHKYVGQTNNLAVRYSAHESASWNPNSKDYNCLFHKKIRQYGLNNFTFYCLEEIDSNDQEYIDSRESFWIKELNSWCSYGEGYKENTGEKKIKKNLSLSDEEINKIKDLIKTTDLEFTKIANMFNTYRDFVSRVNLGRYSFDPNEDYPLRITRSWREVPQEIKMRIAQEILSSNARFEDIAKKYQVSRHLVQQINSGESNLVCDLIFPLRKTNKRLTKEQEDIVKQGLLNGEKTKVIAERAGVSKDVVQRRREKYKNETCNDYPSEGEYGHY